MSAMLDVPNRQLLLRLAREALKAAVLEKPPPPVDPATLTPVLCAPGACFVTLMQRGELRGCIGGLQAEVPLYQEVQRRAAQAALEDYRFDPLRPRDLAELEIEISVLTPPKILNYNHPADLPKLLRPHVDGVILMHGMRRATFLPQVWEKVPQPEQFLSMLCEKMGIAPDTWRHTLLDVDIYEVEKFTEGDLQRIAGAKTAPSQNGQTD